MQNYSTSFSQNSVKMAHGPQKKPLDFGGNLENVTFGFGFGFG